MRAPGQARCSVALIGMRGSGKTTVGRLLADRLGYPFLDTDDMVETRTGKTISQIFTEHGESRFRAYERDAVLSAVNAGPAVISLGGGAVLDSANVDVLQQVAVIVWLTAPADVLWSRLMADAATPLRRPALTDLNGLDELRHSLAVRSNRYELAADHVLDTIAKTPDELVADLTTLLEKTVQR